MIRERIVALHNYLSLPKPRFTTRTGYLNKVDEFIILSFTPNHDILDVLDKHSGIITRFKPDGSLAPLGERVRRLERRILGNKAPPPFSG